MYSILEFSYNKEKAVILTRGGRHIISSKIMQQNVLNELIIEFISNDLMEQYSSRHIEKVAILLFGEPSITVEIPVSYLDYNWHYKIKDLDMEIQDSINNLIKEYEECLLFNA